MATYTIVGLSSLKFYLFWSQHGCIFTKVTGFDPQALMMMTSQQEPSGWFISKTLNPSPSQVSLQRRALNQSILRHGLPELGLGVPLFEDWGKGLGWGLSCCFQPLGLLLRILTRAGNVENPGLSLKVPLTLSSVLNYHPPLCHILSPHPSGSAIIDTSGGRTPARPSLNICTPIDR